MSKRARIEIDEAIEVGEAFNNFIYTYYNIDGYDRLDRSDVESGYDFAVNVAGVRALAEVPRSGFARSDRALSAGTSLTITAEAVEIIDDVEGQALRFNSLVAASSFDFSYSRSSARISTVHAGHADISVTSLFGLLTRSAVEANGATSSDSLAAVVSVLERGSSVIVVSAPESPGAGETLPAPSLEAMRDLGAPEAEVLSLRDRVIETLTSHSDDQALGLEDLMGNVSLDV